MKRLRRTLIQYVFQPLHLFQYLTNILLATIDIGSIDATLTTTGKPISCMPSSLKFGPYYSSRLTLGPNHNEWYEPNPFYLSLVGGEEGEFLGTLQSSLTSTEGNKTWWSLQAWQLDTAGSGPYEIDGSMVNDADDGIGKERNQLSGVWEVGDSPKGGKDRRENRDNADSGDGKGEGDGKDHCAKGTKKLFKWTHVKKQTTLKGQADSDQASITVTGTVTLTLEDGTTEVDPAEGDDSKDEGLSDRLKRVRRRRSRLGQRQETQEMTYTLTFSGKHHSGSAPLPMQGLKWKEAGSGPPLKPYELFAVDLPKAQISTKTTSTRRTTTKTTSSTSSKKHTSTRRPTSSVTSSASVTATITVATTTTVTVTSGAEKDGGGEQGPSNLPGGAITGIVVGGVLAFVLFGAMLFLLKKWRAKNKKPKVYPELAYIYSTPFTSTNKRTKEVGSSGGVGATPTTVGNPESRGVGGEAGTYYGPAAPQLEVDLGDKTPFLAAPATGFGSSTAAMPSGSRGADLGIGTSRRLEEIEEQEREMREPMLPGTAHAEGSSSRHHGEY